MVEGLRNDDEHEEEERKKKKNTCRNHNVNNLHSFCECSISFCHHKKL